jgi:hypothetical protein
MENKPPTMIENVISISSRIPMIAIFTEEAKSWQTLE